MSTREYLIQQYQEIHKDNPRYGRGGVHHLDKISMIVKNHNINSILDFGCGKGNLVKALNDSGIYTEGYDPAILEFSKSPSGQFDMIVCTDVLEHIPDLEIASFCEEMSKYNPRVLFLLISNRIAHQILPDGTNAHKTVEPPNWWLSKLTEALSGYNITIEHINDTNKNSLLIAVST